MMISTAARENFGSDEPSSVETLVVQCDGVRGLLKRGCGSCLLYGCFPFALMMS